MLLYELEGGHLEWPEMIRKEVDRYILFLRFEGHGALERMSQMLKQLGLPFASVGYIAPRLAAYARALPPAGWPDAQIRLEPQHCRPIRVYPCPSAAKIGRL